MSLSAKYTRSFLQTPLSLRDTSPNLGEELLPYTPYKP